MLNVPVLIAGGGPAGMNMALLLNRFGVDSVLVERRPTTTTHPKSRGCHARTMEQFRVWGIEDKVRRAGLPQESDVACWCESLSGPLVAYTQPAPTTNTPAPRSIVPQDAVEEALAEELSSCSRARVDRSTELVDFDQDAEGVTARLHRIADDHTYTVRAQYLIGCDGASSRVRDHLGVVMDGPEQMAMMANHYYRAYVGHLPPRSQRNRILRAARDRAKEDTIVLATGPTGDRWLSVQKLADGEEPMTEARLVEAVREQWGMPDLDVERINVMNWKMSAQVAQQFRVGRVFLVGDAAHRFPTAGGNGLNSGVQDAHNLAWKLAAVLGSTGRDALLDTYESERRPVAQSNTAFAVRNQHRINNMEQAFDRRDEDPETWRQLLREQDNQLHSDGQSMGYIYADGAIVDDGSVVPAHDPQRNWPTDRPGARFPHFWIDADETESTIDWFDTTFVLVCGPDADDWHRVGEELAATVTTALVVKRLPHLLGPVSIERDGAVLVRPDGHVAWRTKTIGNVDELRCALAAVLAGGTRSGVTDPGSALTLRS